MGFGWSQNRTEFKQIQVRRKHQTLHNGEEIGIKEGVVRQEDPGISLGNICFPVWTIKSRERRNLVLNLEQPLNLAYYRIRLRWSNSVCTREPGSSTAFCAQPARREWSHRTALTYEHRAELSPISLAWNS